MVRAGLGGVPVPPVCEMTPCGGDQRQGRGAGRAGDVVAQTCHRRPAAGAAIRCLCGLVEADGGHRPSCLDPWGVKHSVRTQRGHARWPGFLLQGLGTDPAEGPCGVDNRSVSTFRLGRRQPRKRAKYTMDGRWGAGGGAGHATTTQGRPPPMTPATARREPARRQQAGRAECHGVTLNGPSREVVGSLGSAATGGGSLSDYHSRVRWGHEVGGRGATLVRGPTRPKVPFPRKLPQSPAARGDLMRPFHWVVERRVAQAHGGSVRPEATAQYHSWPSSCAGVLDGWVVGLPATAGTKQTSPLPSCGLRCVCVGRRPVGPAIHCIREARPRPRTDRHFLTAARCAR